MEQSVEKGDPDPKTISCYGLYVPELEKVWVRFVDGRPVSSITTRFLEGCCQKLKAGKRDRVCGVFDCPHYEHLSIPENVA